MPNSELLQTGVAGAMIAVVWMFLQALREERKDRKEEREGIWKAIDRLSEAIAKLSGQLRDTAVCPYQNREQDK